MSKAVKPLKIFEVYQYGKLIMTGTLDEIVEKTGLSLSTIRIRIKEERDGMKLKEIGKRMQLYAYYDDEEIIDIGTIEEISEKTGLPKHALYWTLSNAAKTRNLKKKLIPLEGETVIVKRTHNAKYAPVPENEPIREVRRVKRPTMQVSIDQPVKQTKLVINDYHKGLYKSMFKGWA